MPLSGILVDRDPAANPAIQIESLRRAISDRWCRLLSESSICGNPCFIHIVDACHGFSKSKASVKCAKIDFNESSADDVQTNLEGQPPVKKQKRTSVVPCWLSINWQLDVNKAPDSVLTGGCGGRKKVFAQSGGGTLEITTASTGLPQGSSLDVSEGVIAKKKQTIASRLSRYQLNFLYERVYPGKSTMETDYATRKEQSRLDPCATAYLQCRDVFFNHTIFKDWIGYSNGIIAKKHGIE